MVDLNNVGAAIFVFAMPNCPACVEFEPILVQRVRERAREGFVFSDGVTALRPGQIPVFLYDVTSTDPQLQEILRTYNVTMTPTTLVLSRIQAGCCKVEGAMDRDRLDHVLDMAWAVAQ